MCAIIWITNINDTSPTKRKIKREQQTITFQSYNLHGPGEVVNLIHNGPYKVKKSVNDLRMQLKLQNIKINNKLIVIGKKPSLNKKS